MPTPLVLFTGFVVLIFNVGLAVLFPPRSRTAMGLQLFIGGMITLLVSVVDLLNPIGISPFERLLLFSAGSINCSVGYYITLREGH